MNGRFARVCAAMLFLWIAPAIALAQGSAKDTPFGSELVPPNYPDSSLDETVAALASIAQIGGHTSFVWHWDSPEALDWWSGLVPVARNHGLKVFFQVATNFLNTPRPPTGYANSFADAATRSRFLQDIRKLALTQPDYVVLMTEANLLYRFNPTEFEHFRTLYAEAYSVVKEVSPNTKVGVSHHFTVWFIQRYLENVDIPAMITPSDFEAFTTYPEDLMEAGLFSSIAEIPEEWYGLTRASYPNKPILFSEIGWSSKAPHSSPESQAEFLRNLPRLMSIVKPDLITWALFADVGYFQRSLLTQEETIFLMSLGVDIDRLFIRFNGLGLIDFAGGAKPSFSEAAGLVFSTP